VYNNGKSMNDSADNPVINYLREVKAEMLRVSWPSRDQTIRLSVVVVIVAVFCGLLIGFVDYGLVQSLEWLLPDNQL